MLDILAVSRLGFKEASGSSKSPGVQTSLYSLHRGHCVGNYRTVRNIHFSLAGR